MEEYTFKTTLPEERKKLLMEEAPVRLTQQQWDNIQSQRAQKAQTQTQSKPLQTSKEIAMQKAQQQPQQQPQQKQQGVQKPTDPKELGKQGSTNYMDLGRYLKDLTGMKATLLSVELYNLKLGARTFTSKEMYLKRVDGKGLTFESRDKKNQFLFPAVNLRKWDARRMEKNKYKIAIKDKTNMGVQLTFGTGIGSALKGWASAWVGEEVERDA